MSANVQQMHIGNVTVVSAVVDSNKRKRVATWNDLHDTGGWQFSKHGKRNEHIIWIKSYVVLTFHITQLWYEH